MKIFVVEPDAEWAIDPGRGRNMVTLPTCTYPALENRFVLHADGV